MNAYRVVWRAVCASLALVGAGVTLVASPVTLLLLFPTFAVIGCVLTPVVAGEFGKRPPRERIRLVATSALVSGTAAGALAGFVVILGAAVLPLLVLVLVTSPLAVVAYRRWLRAAPSPTAGQLDALARAFAYASPEYVPIQPLTTLRLHTDEQLCQRWRASYLALQESPSGQELIDTVEQRQRYLDEFERRNPGGLSAWLASGARATGNQLHYLVENHGGCPAINWDELTRGQDR